MLDPESLSLLGHAAQGRPVLGGCLVRTESTTRHTANQVRRVAFAVTVAVFVVGLYYALSTFGIVWFGVVFVIGPIGAMLLKTMRGVSAKPKTLHAVLTDQTLLLIDCTTADVPPTVVRAVSRSTIASVTVIGSRLSMTSAGNKVTLLAERSDAEQMAALLRSSQT
jgi:hypothetical protein